MRIVTGGISHETSTFTPVQTTLASYEQRFLLRGDDIIAVFQGTNTPIGGFIEGASGHGFELIPTIFAEPHPSGPTPRLLFDSLLGELLHRVEEAGDIDGILLELHGSMVVGDLDTTDGIDDGEGYILRAIRNLIGPDVPIMPSLTSTPMCPHRWLKWRMFLSGAKRIQRLIRRHEGKNALMYWHVSCTKVYGLRWRCIKFP